MNWATVKHLAEFSEAPAISILCPLDPLQPGNAHDAAVLARLRDEAVDDVARVLSGAAAANLVDRIDEAIGSVDLEHPSRGVAVLVSPNLSRVIEFAAPIGPGVIDGERFAIRELVTAMLRSRSARIIVLSLAKSRCIDVVGDDATERLDFGFPVEVVPPTEADTPHRDFPLSEHEHAEAAKFVFRAVDTAVGEVQKHRHRPLVIVGTDRDVAYFLEVTGHRGDIVGQVPRSHERDTPDQLAQLARPLLVEHERREQERLHDEAREAIGTRAVSGISDVWSAARAGRGRQLVVEDGYRYPAHVVAGALKAAPEGTTGSFDAVSEALEEVVRHNGDVVVVPAGTFADLGHIALFTRY
jgi:hypothetical protein